MRERLLIIGNGPASVRLVEELLQRDSGRFEITVVGDEAEPGYDRSRLTALLSGEVDGAGITLRDAAWYARQGVRLLTGRRVATICGEARVARLDGDDEVAFDTCVFATGAAPARLPIAGAALRGVTGVRRRADIEALAAAAREGRRVAIIGGGVLGVEAAATLARCGAGVTLVHVMDRLMDRQLDGKAAALLKGQLERRGVRVLLDRQARAVTGTGRANGLALADGDRIAADLVVMAVGCVPQAGLAAATGIGVNRGILVDERLATTLPGFHAIGDCTEHRGQLCGASDTAAEQARVLAASLCNEGTAQFVADVPAVALTVAGLQIYSAGEVAGGAGARSIVYEESSPALYRKLVLCDGRLVGALLFGDTADGAWYRGLIRSGRNLDAVRADLIFGRDYAEAGLREAA